METDPVELFKTAGQALVERVRAIQPNQWDDPTPCRNWTVRQLANHVAGGIKALPGALQGQPMPGQPETEDILGDQAATVVEQIVGATVAALSQPGALDATVQAPMGAMPARAFLAIFTGDVAVHTWDLSKAIGADEKMAEPLIALAEQAFEPLLEGGRQMGVFGPEVTPPPEADAQTQLLAKTGRQA